MKYIKLILISVSIVLFSFSLTFATQYFDSYEFSTVETPVYIATYDAEGDYYLTIGEHSLHINLYDFTTYVRVRIYDDDMLQTTVNIDSGTSANLFLAETTSMGDVAVWCDYVDLTHEDKNIMTAITVCSMDDLNDGSYTLTFDEENCKYRLTNTSDATIDYYMQSEQLSHIEHIEQDSNGDIESRTYTLTTYENTYHLDSGHTTIVELLSGDNFTLRVPSEYSNDITSSVPENDTVVIVSPVDDTFTTYPYQQMQIDINLNKFTTFFYEYGLTVNDRTISLEQLQITDLGSTFTRKIQRLSFPVGLEKGLNNITFKVFHGKSVKFQSETVKLTVVDSIDDDADGVDDNTSETIIDDYDYFDATAYDSTTLSSEELEFAISDVVAFLYSIKGFVLNLLTIMSVFFSFLPYPIPQIMSTSIMLIVTIAIIKFIRG